MICDVYLFIFYIKNKKYNIMTFMNMQMAILSGRLVLRIVLLYDSVLYCCTTK